jgi:type IV secretory pathway VirB10-like protein
MSVQTVKPPTYMRYARVEQVLCQELAFRDKLSQKSEAVLKPDGESQLFAPEVIAVTQLIHSSGKDAHKCQKLDVIRAAVELFRIGQASPVPADPAPAPAPVAASPPPPEPKKALPQKPAKPVAAPKPAPKPKVKMEPVQTAPAPSQAQETQKLETTSEKTSDVKSDAKREEVLKAAKDVLTQDTSQASVNPFIPTYTLIITALQNCEMFDELPGKDKRIKALEEIANEFLRLANTFKSPNAKESKKA